MVADSGDDHGIPQAAAPTQVPWSWCRDSDLTWVRLQTGYFGVYRKDEDATAVCRARHRIQVVSPSGFLGDSGRPLDRKQSVAAWARSRRSGLSS